MNSSSDHDKSQKRDPSTLDRSKVAPHNGTDASSKDRQVATGVDRAQAGQAPAGNAPDSSKAPGRHGSEPSRR